MASRSGEKCHNSITRQTGSQITHLSEADEVVARADEVVLVQNLWSVSGAILNLSELIAYVVLRAATHKPDWASRLRQKAATDEDGGLRRGVAGLDVVICRPDPNTLRETR
jgi:hypothetical protein